MEGELLLEFAEARDLVVANTWFMKKKKQMVTYESGGNRSMIDYILLIKGHEDANGCDGYPK